MSVPSLREFPTWEPLLWLLWDANEERLAEPGGYVTGQIARWGWSLPTRPGRATQAEFDLMREMTGRLSEAGIEVIAFIAEISTEGRAVLRLIDPNPAVSPGIGNSHPGALLLVEGAVPAPWRRLPEPSPGAAPAPSADPARLERVLRERLPQAVGASEAEIAAAEERLGRELPAELRALYRVTAARYGQSEEAYADVCREADAVGCELLPLDKVYAADATSRPAPWQHAALKAVVTAPDAAVQDLVGSPGWIVFGDTGGGDRIALDLTPGPSGHVGQIIVIDHEQSVGAGLEAESLTAMVCDGTGSGGGAGTPGPSPVAHVNHASVRSVEAAAHPGLEVLSLGVCRDGERFSLAPVLGLPRLRTLTAYPGTLADPLEIGRLTGLEFLKLCPEDWRVLLDAKAVPRSLLACAVETRMHHHPLDILTLSNEILALWNRPPITRTVLEGHLAG